MARLAIAAATVLLILCLCNRGSAERLVWQDEFDNLDQGKWSHLVTAWGGGNQEFQYYRNSRTNRQVAISSSSSTIATAELTGKWPYRVPPTAILIVALNITS
jgi:hypothetical protein